MTAGLVVQDLSVGYGRRPVLRGIALPAVPRGSLVALLGANAAGKSTLLRALAQQLRYEGQAELDGRSLAGLDRPRRLAAIGYAPQAAPQATSLLAYEFALSALRAAAPDLGHRDAERRIQGVFRRFGLEDQALRPVGELSGGQRQRLGLAQVLARGTPLLLLDEPTSALDLRWEIEVLAALRERATGTGTLCVIALHDINLALRFCDQVAFLGGGGVLAAGPAEATVTPELLRAAYGVDARVETCSNGRPLVLADRAAELQ